MSNLITPVNNTGCFKPEQLGKREIKWIQAGKEVKQSLLNVNLMQKKKKSLKNFTYTDTDTHTHMIELISKFSKVMIQN